MDLLLLLTGPQMTNRAQGQGKISRSTTEHPEPVRWLQVCSFHIGLNDVELVTDFAL